MTKSINCTFFSQNGQSTANEIRADPKLALTRYIVERGKKC